MMKAKSNTALRTAALQSFDPNAAASGGQLFGLPFSPDISEVVIVPVPWDATASYGKGTAKGPEAILEASAQVDLYHPDAAEGWKAGIALDELPEGLKKLNKDTRKITDKIIASLHDGTGEPNALKPLYQQVNATCESLNKRIEERCLHWIEKGKVTGMIGGEHSAPLGFLSALSRKYPKFGILQIDAHADLRKAYEGFTYSHASVMYNALKLPQIAKLVQVGIRDLCLEEVERINQSKGRIKTFYYRDIAAQKMAGTAFQKTVEDIVQELPEWVYLSFDIDGLDPKLCPHTGTPVPGGLEFEEAAYLISAVVKSGRKIIGFDLNEVAPGKDEWDANVGARMLFHMSIQAALSNGVIEYDSVQKKTKPVKKVQKKR